MSLLTIYLATISLISTGIFHIAASSSRTITSIRAFSVVGSISKLTVLETILRICFATNTLSSTSLTHSLCIIFLDNGITNIYFCPCLCVIKSVHAFFMAGFFSKSLISDLVPYKMTNQ